MKLPYQQPEQRYGKKLARYAGFFRSIALEIDASPDRIYRYCEHPAIKRIVTDKNSTAYERTCYLEAYAYGDPGVMLACPGPSLSGLMIRELGREDQVKNFYHYLHEHNARTFFALTEPEKGSDAGKLQCSLIPDLKTGQYLLSGHKCLFGNGAKGHLGVILARTNPGPLGIRAVLITPELLDEKKGWIFRETLPMVGLRGAQIAYMRFENCPITSENLLGEHLSPMQRGMMSVIKTFNRLRTGVGALAIGQAQAVLDYVYENRHTLSDSAIEAYRNMYYQVDLMRKLLRNAAEKVDSSPFESFDISLAKIEATKTAEVVISRSIDLLKPADVLDNPWLAKCYRDSFAWEYMEGTRNMQLKNIFHDFQLTQMGTQADPVKIKAA